MRARPGKRFGEGLCLDLCLVDLVSKIVPQLEKSRKEGKGSLRKDAYGKP